MNFPCVWDTIEYCIARYIFTASGFPSKIEYKNSSFLNHGHRTGRSIHPAEMHIWVICQYSGCENASKHNLLILQFKSFFTNIETGKNSNKL